MEKMDSNNLTVSVYIVDNYVSSLEIYTTNRQEKDFSIKILGKNHYCHPIFVNCMDYVEALRLTQDYLDKYQIEYNREIFGGSNENKNQD